MMDKLGDGRFPLAWLGSLGPVAPARDVALPEAHAVIAVDEQDGPLLKPARVLGDPVVDPQGIPLENHAAGRPFQTLRRVLVELDSHALREGQPVGVDDRQGTWDNGPVPPKPAHPASKPGSVWANMRPQGVLRSVLFDRPRLGRHAVPRPGPPIRPPADLEL